MSRSKRGKNAPKPRVPPFSEKSHPGERIDPERAQTAGDRKADRKYRYLFIACITFGIILRFSLSWINHPLNEFDDHYKPVFRIVQTGTIPGKLDCWECYQPPVFYVTCAIVGKILAYFDVPLLHIMKSLQFLNFLFGSITVWISFLILKRLPVSDFARLWGLGLISFMPRHIYMSAMFGNDALSYLGISVCIYLLLRIMDGEHVFITRLLLLSAAVSLTIFTKYNTFIIIPTVCIAFLLLMWGSERINLKQAVVKGTIVLLMPLIILGGYCVHNEKTYGAALPFNTVLRNPVDCQPSDELQRDFLSFKPWLFIRYPILRPGQLNSFWTLMYSSTWFDTDAKYMMKTGPVDLWTSYYEWLKDKMNPFPDVMAGPIHHDMILVGSLIESLGLVFLVLELSGIVLISKEMLSGSSENQELVKKNIVFITLFVFNAAGCILLVMKTPVYSSIKASYLLTALPSFCALASAGMVLWDKYRITKYIYCPLLSILFSLVTIHIVQLICYTQIYTG